MSKTIRIGTRDSELALWQAHTVQKKLNDLGYTTEIVAVKSQGDIILDKPLYELGITGIFTKTLDIAMINGQVDIAVHSRKLTESDWNGAVFAAAGLERINLKPDNYINLDWMIPAPAQGAMLVVAMANDEFTKDAVSQLNDIETEICTYIERQFLKTLEGGCTAPIGALAQYDEEKDTIEFKGVLFSVDGKQKIAIEKSVDISEWKKLGFHSAQEILNNGGAQLMSQIKATLKK
jgi:hydroxymethylbilane synthase